MYMQDTKNSDVSGGDARLKVNVHYYMRGQPAHITGHNANNANNANNATKECRFVPLFMEQIGACVLMATEREERFLCWRVARVT